MIAGVAAQHLAARGLALRDGVLSCQLDGGFVRFRSARADEDTLEAGARMFRNEIGEIDIWLVLEMLSACKTDFVRLIGHGGDDAFVAVAEIGCHRSAACIQILSFLGIPDPGALAV